MLIRKSSEKKKKKNQSLRATEHWYIIIIIMTTQKCILIHPIIVQYISIQGLLIHDMYNVMPWKRFDS